ncbi:PfkB family carbohydrate kinase [Propionimicrobium sp. PCR01-08-3]|uniref:PfkB family carbohydrate kinase n=1 Tax=Propionimicrobium sp. PCR01-08-3 TaxID=3052086 RepID=UPI00255C97A7|nr:PfkB family carbohydrate kinase [Propionimicrobium sp. PCR01-08-3]WIY83493.1 PfkB family carbohydrate kinase [Propionimicrobium sp. PCR01-08-3]
MTQIWVLGLYTLDHLYYVHSLPRAEESIMAKRYLVADGGKGANQAVCAGLLGSEVHLVTHLGTDAAGDRAAEMLVQHGLHLDRVLHNGQPTANSSIVIDDQGNQTITTFAGGALLIRPDEVGRMLASASTQAILSLQGELTMDVFRAAREAWHGSVVVNPSPVETFLEDSGELSGVDWLIVNQLEAQALTAASAPTARLVAAAVGAQAAIVTGANAVLVSQNGQPDRHYPVPQVAPVDTTGAGDAFAGAFLSALADARCIDECIDTAMKVAAFSVQREGCIQSYPSPDDLI